MSQRQERIDRIVAVEREYLAASVASDLLQERLAADPAFLASHELRSRDARNLQAHLEGTYVIRLCAEFEAGLRDAWRNAFARQTQPPLRDLLAAVAARRLVPQDALDRADEVREYRNALVHENAPDVATIPIAEVRRHLCRFFSRLPSRW
jgi:hypothetical protein